MGFLGHLSVSREDKLVSIAVVRDPFFLMAGWSIFGLSRSAGVGSMHLCLVNSLICIAFIY